MIFEGQAALAAVVCDGGNAGDESWALAAAAAEDNDGWAR